MKRCPICFTVYDDSLRFCQADGAMLIEGTDQGSASESWNASVEQPKLDATLEVERPSVTFGAPSGAGMPSGQWTSAPPPGAWREGAVGAPPPQHFPRPAVEDKSLATWSMVLGVLGIACCGVFTAIPAIILGVMAKNKISEQPALYGGSGLATAGIVLGIIGTVLSILAAILQVALIANDSSTF